MFTVQVVVRVVVPGVFNCTLLGTVFTLTQSSVQWQIETNLWAKRTFKVRRG